MYRIISCPFFRDLSFDILWLCPLGWVKDLSQGGFIILAECEKR